MEEGTEDVLAIENIKKRSQRSECKNWIVPTKVPSTKKTRDEHKAKKRS